VAPQNACCQAEGVVVPHGGRPSGKEPVGIGTQTGTQLLARARRPRLHELPDPRAKRARGDAPVERAQFEVGVGIDPAGRKDARTEVCDRSVHLAR
jgi:hypothetical protein